MGVLMYSYTNVHNALQGRIQDFFQDGVHSSLALLQQQSTTQFLFWQNTSCIREPQVISGGGGCAPPAPSPQIRPCIMIKKCLSKALLIWRKLSRVERSPAYPSYPRRTNFSYIFLQNVANCLHVKKKVGSARKDDLSSRIIIL